MTRALTKAPCHAPRDLWSSLHREQKLEYSQSWAYSALVYLLSLLRQEDYLDHEFESCLGNIVILC